MAEQNARQRMKLLPSTESHSHSQTYFFKRDQGGEQGNQEETIGDGAIIHHGPSYESNQELKK